MFFMRRSALVLIMSLSLMLSSWGRAVAEEEVSNGEQSKTINLVNGAKAIAVCLGYMREITKEMVLAYHQLVEILAVLFLPIIPTLNRVL
jgi:heme/copper-type cytochrome/quinol oxidase subunit 3